MEEKKVYAITDNLGLSRIMRLTKAQYKAINWFINTYDGVDLESIVIEPVEDAAEEIGGVEIKIWKCYYLYD